MHAVQHIRKKLLKVNQAGLAEIAGTTQATVSRWERGELHPDLNQLAAMRAEVIRRGIRWKDAWFFDVPERAA